MKSAWNLTARTVLAYSNSYSWSTDDTVMTVEPDAGLFQDGKPTIIRGAGGFIVDENDPAGTSARFAAALANHTFSLAANAIAQADKSKSISYLSTVYYTGRGDPEQRLRRPRNDEGIRRRRLRWICGRPRRDQGRRTRAGSTAASTACR